MSVLSFMLSSYFYFEFNPPLLSAGAPGEARPVLGVDAVVPESVPHSCRREGSPGAAVLCPVGSSLG